MRFSRLLLLTPLLWPLLTHAVTVTTALNFIDPVPPEQISGYGHYTSNSQRGNGYAEGESAPGVLKAYVSGSVSSTDPSFDSYSAAEAIVYTRDSVIVNSPGHEGATGTAVLNFYVPGDLILSMTGTVGHRTYAIASFGVTANENQVSHSHSIWDYLDDEINTYPDDRWITVPVTFTFGEAWDFNTYLSIAGAAHVTGIGDVTFVVDYSNSVYFGGISDLSSGGIELLDYTALGLGGFDYTKSFVPSSSPHVPDDASTAVLVALAGAGMLLSRRRGNSS